MRPFVLLAASLVLFLASGCATMPPSDPHHPLSPAGASTKPLPDFKRRTIDGASFDTTSARGRVTVVKFFAKYCEPCKQTLPWFQQFVSGHKDVVVVGIAEDERESDVREMVQAYGLSFPIVQDTGNALSGRFRVTEMPVTFVADRAGRVRWVGGAGQTEDELEAAVSASR